MRILKYFGYVGDREVHYRRAGSGPPLVLLHPAPGSSFALEPLIRELATGRTVIALDTPGAGESAGLGLAAPSCADYSDALAKTLDWMGLDRVDLYGSHTGATLALDFAHRHARRVNRVILNALAAYTEDERTDLVANYAPSLKPQWDGSHLVRTWAMRRDMLLFWPWYRRTPEARRVLDMPTAGGLHDKVLDMMRAGPLYWQLYHASFRYEPTEALARLSVPTMITVGPDDPLAEHLGRLPDRVENAEIRMRRTSDLADLADLVQSFLADPDLPDAPPPRRAALDPGTVQRGYVATSAGQMLVRRIPGEGRPLLLLQASPPGSGAALEPLMRAMGADRPALALDTPGNGDSAPFSGKPDMADLARLVGEVCDAEGHEDYDVYGNHTGAVLGMQLAIERPSLVRHLILDGIPIYTPDESQDFIDNYQPPMVPSWDGSHLLWAWNYLRDVLLWWPFYARTAAGTRVGRFAPAADIHHSLVEFLKGGRTYHHNFVALWEYPTTERLPLIKAEMLICARPTDPWIVHLEAASRILPTARIEQTEDLAVPIHSRYRELVSPESTIALYRAFLQDALP
ncbi:MAG: alpha/beta hydrolase [bacterium]|nr:alpha/beta hydrolase [bacterium]